MMSNQEQINRFFSRRAINLDISFRCSLKCSMCARQTDYKNIRPVPGRDLTISEFKIIVDYFDVISCCGQISDPIFNPNLIDFIKIAKEKDKELIIHTAASQKSIKWYEEAFDNFGEGEWIFGIDGLPEESHKYRINQDGTKLFNMAKLCVSKGIKTRWQYIVFKYNEDHIEQAKQMAHDNGMTFEISLSSRFSENDPYKPTNPNMWIDANDFAILGNLNV